MIYFYLQLFLLFLYLNHFSCELFSNVLNNINETRILSHIKSNHITISNVNNEEVAQPELKKSNVVIPLHIYVSWHTQKHKVPSKMLQSIEHMKYTNPEFTYHIFDLIESREFLQNNFDSNVIEAFDTLIPSIYKLDLWSYCILYKLGGIYIDIKFQMNNNIKLIDFTDKEYFVLERPVFPQSKGWSSTIELSEELDLVNNQTYYRKFKDKLKYLWPNELIGIHNGLIIVKPGNKILLETINNIVFNVKMKEYGKDCLSITGPSILGKTYFTIMNDNTHSKWNLFDLYFSINGNYIFSKNNVIVKYYHGYEDDELKLSQGPNYYELWRDRKIYIDSNSNNDHSKGNKNRIDNRPKRHYEVFNSLNKSSKYDVQTTRVSKGGIPMNIYLSWHTHDLPLKMKANIEELKQKNPEFQFYIFDQKESREIIKTYYTEQVLDAYDTLIPAAFKSDLWRYCMLFKFGGIYIDIKYHFIDNNKFSDFIDKEYFVLEKPMYLNTTVWPKLTITYEEEYKMINSKTYYNDVKDKLIYAWRDSLIGIQNCLIIVKPLNTILYDTIVKVVDNVKNKRHGKECLAVTGPTVLGTAYFDFYKDLKHEHWENFELFYSMNGNYILTKKKHILEFYPDYRDEEHRFQQTEYYVDLWKAKKIFKGYDEDLEKQKLKSQRSGNHN